VRLEKQFDVGVPLEKAWSQLADMDALAACVPGSDLRRSRSGELYTGEVALGSNGSSALCLGTLRQLDLDEDGRTATLRVHGRLLSAPALGDGTLRARLEPAGDSTRVLLDADLRLTGVPVPASEVEVGGRAALDEFAAGLERRMREAPAVQERAPAPQPAAEPGGTGERIPRRTTEPAAESGSAITGYAGAAALALATAGVARALLRGRRRTRFSIEYRW
jgi:carbon monoxide dehydrogenase subunit G